MLFSPLLCRASDPLPEREWVFVRPSEESSSSRAIDEFARILTAPWTSSIEECDAAPMFWSKDCARDRTETEMDPALDRDDDEPECEFVREWEDPEPYVRRWCDRLLAR